MKAKYEVMARRVGEWFEKDVWVTIDSFTPSPGSSKLIGHTDLKFTISRQKQEPDVEILIKGCTVHREKDGFGVELPKLSNGESLSLPDKGSWTAVQAEFRQEFKWLLERYPELNEFYKAA